MRAPPPVLRQRRRIQLVVLADLLVLAELCVAMYVAHHHPQRFTPVFLTVFFGLLLPTVIVARRLLNRLAAPEAEGS
jgi:hypothetical protein